MIAAANPTPGANTAPTSHPDPPASLPTTRAGPLAGLKVLELGQLIAGPSAGKTLADFGAEVIKIEPPGDGDPLRNWRLLHNGTSVWWQVQSRNKHSVVLDLRTDAGRADARHLAAECDVLIENVKPGTLEKWGLGYDTLAALHGVIGVLLALQARGQRTSLLAPKDRSQVVIGGNGDSIFKRLMAAIGPDDLDQDPSLADDAQRAASVDTLDAAITAWTVQRPVAEVVASLQAVSVPVGRIHTVADIASDPHYLARGMVQHITTADGLHLAVPGVVPKLSATPGSLRNLAPVLGQHTALVPDALRLRIGGAGLAPDGDHKGSTIP